MRPGAGTELPMSQRFDYPSPSARNLQVNTAVILRIGVSFTPVIRPLARQTNLLFSAKPDHPLQHDAR